MDRNINYFELLNMPLSYDISEDKLLQVYLHKQRRSHPDSDDSNNTEMSSYLNVAYKTLMNPISRGEHFLKLHGEDVGILSLNDAEKMFDMREQFSLLNTDYEKNSFCNNLKQQLNDLIGKLKKEKNVQSFKKIFSLAYFIDSFLKKVNADAFDRY